MDERIAEALHILPETLSQHVVLSAAALALGVAVSLPLAILVTQRPRLRWPVLAVAGLVQTIPGLALLALFYPLLLALSVLTAATLGFRLPALGFLPSLLALALYAMLPVIRNTVAGLDGIDRDLIEAADGVGMTRRQRLFQVQLPLAAPVILAGIRTASVWTIGAATLSTPVGQTSLGNYIFSGLQTENWIFVLFGCTLAALLALAVDGLLALIEGGVARRDRRRLAGGLMGLVLGTTAALAGTAAPARSNVVVGAKNFGEQFILAELMAERLKGAGLAVESRQGLGSAVVFRALAASEIDVYVDYSGTLWANVMGRTDAIPREAMLDEITRWMEERHGVRVLGPLGFENAYALAMKAEQARASGIATLADLAAHASGLRLGADLEFLSRPEWATLRQAYGLAFGGARSFTPTFMYRALASGEADVISAFSSDGRIKAMDLVVLADPKGAIPAYDAVILVCPRRAADQRVLRALRPLLNAIPVERMREANLMVDRDTDKRSPAEAARHLAEQLGLPP